MKREEKISKSGRKGGKEGRVKGKREGTRKEGTGRRKKRRRRGDGGCVLIEKECEETLI